jgi:hypothetical protein
MGLSPCCLHPCACKQGGAVLGRPWQPHESHLPYLLQLKIDFNLAGMGWLRLSHARFRWVPCGERLGVCSTSVHQCQNAWGTSGFSHGKYCDGLCLAPWLPAGIRCPRPSLGSAGAGPHGSWWLGASQGQTACCLRARWRGRLRDRGAPAHLVAAPASACGCGPPAPFRAAGCGEGAEAHQCLGQRGWGLQSQRAAAAMVAAGAVGAAGCRGGRVHASWSWMPVWSTYSTVSRCGAELAV